MLIFSFTEAYSVFRSNYLIFIMHSIVVAINVLLCKGKHSQLFTLLCLCIMFCFLYPPVAGPHRFTLCTSPWGICDVTSKGCLTTWIEKSSGEIGTWGEEQRLNIEILNLCFLFHIAHWPVHNWIYQLSFLFFSFFVVKLRNKAMKTVKKTNKQNISNKDLKEVTVSEILLQRQYKTRWFLELNWIFCLFMFKGYSTLKVC